jgi:signal transduction histidine kinase
MQEDGSTAETQFAPAKRLQRHVIELQSKVFQKSPLYSEIIDAISALVMVLNPQRQIIFANHHLLEFLGLPDLVAFLGARPGEAIQCMHSNETTGGRSGAAEYCSTCGAVMAIISSLNGTPATSEIRIMRTRDNEPLDLRIIACPLVVGDDFFSITTLIDISNEKRRNALEQIFFHDVLNTATGLVGYIDLSDEATPEEIHEFRPLIKELSHMLVDEIQAQRELLAAEHNELVEKISSLQSLELLRAIREMYGTQSSAAGKSIAIADTVAEVCFASDSLLLRRVLGNMVKNALEASTAGQTITLGCDHEWPHLSFWVHNQTAMTREVQLQVFQRSFSTRGSNRGLGTYSIRLLTERYLHGTAAFTSSPEQGTRFTVTLPIEVS